MRKNKSRREKVSTTVKRPKAELDKLKFSAYQLVVVQGKTQKEAAETVGVSEVTMSDWSKEGDWRNQRLSRQQDHRTEVENIKQIMRLTSDRRLEIESDIAAAQKTEDKKLEAELRAEANRLSDSISKWGKALRELDKNNRYTLGELINMIDDMFTDMRQYDPELFERTIPFQQYYIRKKTNELG